MSYEMAQEELREELGSDHPSIERFEELHDEIRELGGLSRENK